MKELRAKQYFQLQASAIPDNKIKQVSGTYAKLYYSDQQSTKHQQYDKGEIMQFGILVPNKSIPLYNYQSTGYFIGVYDYKVRYEYTGGFTPHGFREERVEMSVYMTIYDTYPISYVPNQAQAFIETVGGVKFTRSYSGSQSDIWMTAYDNQTDRIEAPWAYNTPAMSGPEGTYTDESITSWDILDVYVISPYNGKVIDPDTGQYRLDLKIRTNAFINYQSSSSSGIGMTAEVSQYVLENFTVVVPYYRISVATSEDDAAFEYHNEDADYANYPLQIKSNEFGTEKTTIAPISTMIQIPWYEYVSNNILSMYSEGKLWITAKVKASFLIDNNLDINSSIFIKTIDNTYITRLVDDNGTLVEKNCIFSIKNIEYNYSGSEFIANICLLEIGTATARDRPIDDPHFFNLPITDWESLTINEMLIIYE